MARTASLDVISQQEIDAERPAACDSFGGGAWREGDGGADASADTAEAGKVKGAEEREAATGG